MAEHHEMMDGRLHLYKRPGSSYWQCSAFLEGRNLRVSTKQSSLALAKDFAEDWYLGLRGKQLRGQLKFEKTFKEAAEKFLAEYEVITEGQRNPDYVKTFEIKLRVHLLPFFGEKVLSDITPGLIQEFRIHRHKTAKNRKQPSRSTLHKDIVTLRQVLKTALRHGWLNHLPDMTAPYKTSGKIVHRAWFSPQEYRTLYLATRKRAQTPIRDRWKGACEQMHDYVLFMGNTGLRPDEAARLQYRDVKVVKDYDSGQTILEIEVRGKRGIGYCKSTTGAVRPFIRLRTRNQPKPDDLIFPGGGQHELFNRILTEENLKFDRDGNRRTAYSLRHTYICIRLMEGADIYQIAKNCRTSVEMIEKFYASHIKTTLDASAINVSKSKQRLEAARALRAADA